MTVDRRKKETLRDLAAVDWDFPEKLPGSGASIHWYPASFHVSLPATLVEALSAPGDLVFDPYAGTGATGLEALRLGRRAWLVDSNPVAVLASYAAAGLTLLERRRKGLGEEALGALYDATVSHLKRSQRLLYERAPLDGRFSEELASLLRPKPDVLLRMVFGAESSQWEELARWFHPRTLEHLRTLWSLVERISDGWLRSLGFAMMSAVTRAASSQTQSWGHIADRVFPETLVEKDIVSSAARWLTCKGNDIRALSFARQRRDRRTAAYVVRHDWLSHAAPPMGRSRGGVDLLLTSPPYPDAIDYFRAQRLSLLLLGHSEVAIHALAVTEIGSRRKRFRSGSHTQWEMDLLRPLERQLSFVNDASSHVAMVLPHRELSARDDSMAVRGRMMSAGWRIMFEVVRSIRETRTRQSWTSIKQERILVFGKV